MPRYLALASLLTFFGCSSGVGHADLARTDTTPTNAEGPTELATDDVDLSHLFEPYEAAAIDVVVDGSPGTRVAIEICDDLRASRTLPVAPSTSMESCSGASVDLYEDRGDDLLGELHWEGTGGTVEVVYDAEAQTATLTLHAAMTPRVVFADLAATGTFELSGTVEIDSL